MNIIDINNIHGFKIGSTENAEAATGVTVIISEAGATAGVDVRGGGPATRETDLLKPENMVQQINAVVLSGGSAYGLEAASGVMDELEKRNVGFETGFGLVPIVCGASLFDLCVGKSDVRPDKAMGSVAVEKAFQGSFEHGNHGAGTGATVGKYKGPGRMMKSGQGSSAIEVGKLQVGAISAVNALGDIFDEEGTEIAGMLSEDGMSFTPTAEIIMKDMSEQFDVFKGNTTITCIITNAILTKAQCTKLASIAHDGYARAIKPVHSTADGDTIFVMASGEVEVNFDALAVAATDQVQRAIIDGTKKAESAYGLLAYSERKK
ncbi:P1 family peptidase [Aminicella lysinilytica]|uniref:L-aminopeptidase/D-esterase-like protein n=1 Tax=Aminicella lysinilytica TaxID=433323 RepID=A0A4R6Q7P7_9FIRM|nr:P1 family peptidase [Aminicella lysinilytica]TDP58120.1 L-aminopeptidase/D-esterase-like protein [Aminicella lysinilytica]